MAASSSVVVSIACLHPTLLLSMFTAVLPLSFISCSWFSPAVQHLHYSVLALFSSGAFYLPFIISISSQFLCILALFCSCKLPRYSPISLAHDLGTTEGGFLLSGLCSPQHKVTHKTRQVLVLHSQGLEPGHKAQLLVSFCTLGRERRRSKGSEGRTTLQNCPESCRGSVRLCHRAPFYLVKEKEDVEEKVLLCPCRPR